MSERYYLAYGSNLNIDQMKVRCKDATIIGKAELEGYELLFKGSQTCAYLTVEKKENSFVPLGVWRTGEEDEKSLDHYEGFPTFYYKKELEIEVESFKTGEKKKLQAYIYIMHEDRKLGLPSRTYIDTCLKGYEDFGFDKKILLEAIEKSKSYCHER